jgi:nicotinate-nucleotide adenylyltransferase
MPQENTANPGPEGRKPSKTAVLGGSFNPPHIGHLHAAAEAVERLGYDRVLFVPAKINPLKEIEPGASDAQRIAMVRLAIAGTPAFELETCEMERDGPSYTYDTVKYLTEKYAGALEGKIGVIVGDDLTGEFCRWHKAEELSRIADIVLARRKEEEEETELPYPHITLGNALLPVTSTEIRERIREGKPWRHLAGENVSEYIIAEKLYGYRNI